MITLLMVVLIGGSQTHEHTCVQISASLCKDQPITPLVDLMKKSGVQEVRRVPGDYILEFSQGMILPTANGAKPPQLFQAQTYKTCV